MDIVNGYSNTFVSGTADNDYINNNRTSVTVDGGAGNLSTVNIGYDDDNSVSFVVADFKVIYRLATLPIMPSAILTSTTKTFLCCLIYRRELFNTTA